MSKVQDALKKGVSEPLEAGGAMARTVDAGGRSIKVGIEITKVVIAVIDIFFSEVGGALRSGLGLLQGQFKGAESVIKGTNILERGREWENSGIRKGFLKSSEKAVNKICLTAAHALDAVGFVDKVSMGFLGHTASFFGLVFPVFELVKNAFIMVSSGAGILVAKKEKSAANKKVSDGKRNLAKWEKRQKEASSPLAARSLEGTLQHKIDLIVALPKFNVSSYQKLEEKVESLDRKILHANTRLKTVHGSEKKALRKEIKTDKKTFEEVDRSFQKCKSKTKSIKALDKGKVDNLMEHKITKFKARIADNKIARKRSWISIAADIGKMIGIVLGMSSVIFATLFPVLSLPTAVLLLSGFGVISYSIGLGKVLYKEVGPQQGRTEITKLAV